MPIVDSRLAYNNQSIDNLKLDNCKRPTRYRVVVLTSWDRIRIFG